MSAVRHFKGETAETSNKSNLIAIVFKYKIK